MALGKNLAAMLLAGGLLLSPLNLNSYFIMYNKIKNVMIVPGHDGRKSSNRETGRAGNEAEIALRISSRLEKKLKESGFKVFVTRDSDCYTQPLIDYTKKHFKLKNTYSIPYKIILRGIANYANENNFDLILNIHMDKTKADKKRIKGFSVMCSTDNLKANESGELTSYTRNSMEKEFKVSNLYGKFFDGIIKRENVLLLGKHETPIKPISMLIECGYIDDLNFRKSKTLDKVSECIYEGIMKYDEKCGD